MDCSLHEDVEACKQLWERWSPRKSLYDLWDYREPFLNVYQFPLSFAVFREEGKELGMLPLWKTDADHYRWFGDTGDEFDWQEDNGFWAKDPARVSEMLTLLPTPITLTSLTPDAAAMIDENPCVREGLSKSVLPLENIHSVEDYLMYLPKKLRQNTRREQRRVAELNPELTSDCREDMQKLIDLNKASFGDSPLHEEKLAEVFLQITQNERSDSYAVHFFTLRVQGEIVGVDCIFLWNGIYYPLLCGYNKQAAPGIGHYMNLVDIEHALSLKAKVMDFGVTEAGMLKEKQFPLIKQYVYERT